MVLRISATDLSFPTLYKMSFYRFLFSVFAMALFFPTLYKLSFCPQNYRFLDLLQVLCVCDGVAIPNNQSYIVEQWLRESRVRNRPRPHKPRQTHTPYTATIMIYQPLFSSDMFIKQRIYFMLLVFFSCGLIVSRTACI